MANEEHVRMLVNSTAEEWNAWRALDRNLEPDLSGVILCQEFDNALGGHTGAVLSLHGRNMRDALLVSTDFRDVDIRGADFTGAYIECAWWPRSMFDGGPRPLGLEYATDEEPDYSDCDDGCLPEDDASYPADCTGRCSNVFSPNEDHFANLLSGVKVWNEWRSEAPSVRPNLSGLDLRERFEADGQIGKDETIDLSEIDLTGTILRGTKFRGIKMGGSIFDAADLRCSKWSGVYAERSSLRGADLRNTNISYSNLNRCDFAAANTNGLRFDKVRLSHAILRRADLRDNSLSSCDLSFSDLSDAHLCGATIDGVDMTGTRLYAARIWKAELFKDEPIFRFDTHGNGEQRTIPSVDALFRELSVALRFGVDGTGRNDDESKQHRANRLLTEFFYRGHGDIDWSLRPTVIRRESYVQHESELMSELAMKQPLAFREDAVFFQRLVRARHFELPTRLLDVTSNPLTALYYAAEPTQSKSDGSFQIFGVNPGMMYSFDSDTVSLIANFTRLTYDEKQVLLTRRRAGGIGGNSLTDVERDWDEGQYEFAMKRLIHFIAGEKPYWEDRLRPVDLFRVLLVRPESSFERLRVHDGAFLISAFHRNLSPVKVNLEVPGAGMYSRVVYRVPHGAKERIRSQLELVGINEESLKSDLGSAAKAVADKIRRRPVTGPTRWLDG